MWRGFRQCHRGANRIVQAASERGCHRLSVCRVNDGSSLPRQVVCGAKNFRAGDKAPLALPGALFAGRRQNRGKQSCAALSPEGMLCSVRKELNLAEDAAGLFDLAR